MAEEKRSCVLTFDVGGHHVSAAVCQSNNLILGQVVSAQHADIKTSDGFIELLFSLASKATNGQGMGCDTTLAVPGPFDFEAGVSRMRHKLPYLYGVDLRSALAGRIGCKPSQVRFLNDADAYLLGEIGAGAAKGFARAVGLTLGTGIGSAFAFNGMLTTTAPGVPNGGEIWNVPYESGIVEDFVSSRAITNNYAQRTGKTISVVELATAARRDVDAAKAFDEFGHHLGRVVGSLLADFAPDVIVLGGSISRSADLFLPVTREQIPNHSVQIRVSELLDRAPLVGCAVASVDAWHKTTAESASDGSIASQVLSALPVN